MQARLQARFLKIMQWVAAEAAPTVATEEAQASSSIGRAAVSKTAGWGFETLLACHHDR